MIIRTENNRVIFYLLAEDSEVEGIRINAELPEKEENGMNADLHYTEEDGLFYIYTEKPKFIPEIPAEVQPTLEQRVTDIEQVTTEVITALNEKGIVP